MLQPDLSLLQQLAEDGRRAARLRRGGGRRDQLLRAYSRSAAEFAGRRTLDRHWRGGRRRCSPADLRNSRQPASGCHGCSSASPSCVASAVAASATSALRRRPQGSGSDPRWLAIAASGRERLAFARRGVVVGGGRSATCRGDSAVQRCPSGPTVRGWCPGARARGKERSGARDRS
jgi:hypothetical protein